MNFVVVLIALLMLGALASLVYGVVLMAKGGEGSAERQNKMMAYRVWFQAAAIGILLAVFYITKN